MNNTRVLEFLEFFESEPTNKIFYITEKERKSFSSLIISCFLFDLVCEYYDKKRIIRIISGLSENLTVKI